MKLFLFFLNFKLDRAQKYVQHGFQPYPTGLRPSTGDAFLVILRVCDACYLRYRRKSEFSQAHPSFELNYLSPAPVLHAGSFAKSNVPVQSLSASSSASLSSTNHRCAELASQQGCATDVSDVSDVLNVPSRNSSARQRPPAGAASWHQEQLFQALIDLIAPSTACSSHLMNVSGCSSSHRKVLSQQSLFF